MAVRGVLQGLDVPTEQVGESRIDSNSWGKQNRLKCDANHLCLVKNDNVHRLNGVGVAPGIRVW